MVALLVRLKLSLLSSGLSRSTWRLVGLIFGALYALLVAGLAVVGQGALRFAFPEYAAPASIVGLSLLTLGWLLLPLLAAGFDDTLDPGQFALLGLRARQLLPGMAVAVLVGVPGVATVLALAGQLVVWSIGPLPFLAALVAVPLGLATAVVGSRVVVGVAGVLTSTRRFREVTNVALMILLTGSGTLANLGMESVRRAGGVPLARLQEMADVMAWTPLGWAWAVPAEVAVGRWGVAGLHLVLAVALVAGLTTAWERLLDQALVSPLTSGGGGHVVSGRGWLDRLTGTAVVGAILARSLRYWRRDPRYLQGGLAALILPVILVVPASAGGADGRLALFMAAPLLSVFISMTVANDLSYDGPAVWMHVSAGIRGWQDRLGRALAVLVLALPVLAAFLVLARVTTGRSDVTWAVAAASIGLALGGVGAGAWSGAYLQVPVPPPGANPFRSRSGGGTAGLLLMGLTMAGTGVLALPGIVIGGLLWWLARDQPLWGALGVAAAAAFGLGAAWLGIVQGGAGLDQRWPEVLGTVTRQEE